MFKEENFLYLKIFILHLIRKFHYQFVLISFKISVKQLIFFYLIVNFVITRAKIIMSSEKRNQRKRAPEIKCVGCNSGNTALCNAVSFPQFYVFGCYVFVATFLLLWFLRFLPICQTRRVILVTIQEEIGIFSFQFSGDW